MEPEPYVVQQLRKAIAYYEKGNIYAAKDAISRALDDMPEGPAGDIEAEYIRQRLAGWCIDNVIAESQRARDE